MKPDWTEGQRSLAAVLAAVPRHPDDAAHPDYVEMCADLPDTVLEAVAAELEGYIAAGLKWQPHYQTLLDMIKAAMYADWDLLLVLDRVRRENQQLRLPLEG